MPRLGDIYGRRKCFIIAMVANTLLYTALLLTSDLDIATAIIFMSGFFCSFRCGVGYIYLMELMPSNA